MTATLAESGARGAAVTLAARLARAALGVATLAVLGRLLEPRDYGIYAMVVAIAGFADLIRDFGMYNAAVHAKTLDHRQQSALFWINTGLGLAVTAAVAAAAGAIAAFYGEPALVAVAIAISPVFLLSGMTVQARVTLARQLRFTAIAVSEVASGVVAAVVGIALALAGFGYWSLVAQALTQALGLLVMAALAARWVPGRPRRAAGIGPVVRYGLHATGQQLLSYAVRNLGTIVIGRSLGAASLGFYDRANQIVTIPISQVNAPLSRVAVPVLSRAWHAGGDFQRYLSRSQFVGAFLTAPGLILIAGIGPQVVATVMGPGWDQAGEILRLLAIGGAFRSLAQTAYWGYLSSGHPGDQLRYDLVALPLVAALTLAGLPWGAMGVAAGHAVAYTLYWAVGMAVMGRNIGIPVRELYVNGTLAVLLVGAPPALAGWGLSTLGLNPIAVVAVTCAAALAWLPIACAFAPPVKEQYVWGLAKARASIARRH